MLTDAASRPVEPPGYSGGAVVVQSVQTESSASRDNAQQQHLISKRAWEVALAPLKSLPMNLFMMYMAGNSIRCDVHFYCRMRYKVLTCLQHFSDNDGMHDGVEAVEGTSRHQRHVQVYAKLLYTCNATLN